MSGSRSDAARGARRPSTDSEEGLMPGDLRVASPQMLPSGSWEQASVDEEAAVIHRTFSSSSRPPSARELRKFDPSTPTLIDEDEEPEMLFRRISPTKQTDDSMRRTPGAAMYRSVYELEEATASMSLAEHENPSESGRVVSEGDFRRAASAPPVSSMKSEKDSLFVARPRDLQNQQQQGIWESISNQSGTPSPVNRSRDLIQPSRPPLAPPQTSGSITSHAAPGKTTSTTTARAGEAQGLFSSAPWARSNAPAGEEGGRQQGAFSPNLLRLTENIGNILNEDEDDDYAVDIPALRGTESLPGDGLSQFGGGDWTGSYVFNQERGDTGQRRLGRSSATPKGAFKEGRPRRQTQNKLGRHQLQHASRPQPRRSGNDLPQFGPIQNQAVPSGQMFHFGGAFEPPRDHHRPPPATQPGDSSPFAPQDRPGSAEFASMPYKEHNPLPTSAHGSLFHVPSPSPTAGAALGEYLAPENYQQRPEMHAMAREFVPTSNAQTMTPPPQFFPGPGWTNQPMQPQHQPPQAPHFSRQSPGVDQGWSGYGFGAGSVYGMLSPTVDVTRSTLTPSPHMDPWGSQQVAVNPEAGSFSPLQLTRPQSEETLGPPTISDQAAREFKQGKNTKRGKRGRKKTKSTKKIKESPTGRPGSSLQNEEGNATESDSGLDPRRTEVEESHAARVAHKDFSKAFRNAEKESFQKAEEFALGALKDGTLPESVHWKVYLDLADLAKRANRYVEARALYKRVCELQPTANQGWLEYSKLEEECGHMNRVTNILHNGLEHCEYSENLLMRAIKHQEKMGNLDGARRLLARLQYKGIEKVWKTVLEGALLEARAGNASMARRVLKYLMHHVPWYGPLYLEAYKLERDLGRPQDALEIVEQGLQAIPRYGPLWFGAFRLCEGLDMAERYYALPQTMAIISRATMNISKELVWKVHLEAAHMLERSAIEQARFGANVNEVLEPARFRFSLTLLTCPANLRWKVWLATARMELNVGNSETARVLFLRAHAVVPDKGRSASLLDCSRMEEFIGETEVARAVLCKGRFEYPNDWKVWLESVLLEMRNNESAKAIDIATQALRLHKGTGRLWATLVQLNQSMGGDAEQLKALKRALNAVPKSGEVWCEGARIHLNPFSLSFDLERARRHLYFATKFTPQYGDSFIECIRLELMKQWVEPVAGYIWEATKQSIEPCTPADHDRLTKYITDILLLVSLSWNGRALDDSAQRRCRYYSLIPEVSSRLKHLEGLVDLSDVRLSCSNADPNYGTIWFSCRHVPTDTPRKVIDDASIYVSSEVQRYLHLYIAAVVRRRVILSTLSEERPGINENPLEISDPSMEAWENKSDSALQSGPSLQHVLNPTDPTTGFGLFDSVTDGSAFVTALSSQSKTKTIKEMTLPERRKVLFGTDALFS